jgi:hypothetical protein
MKPYFHTEVGFFVFFLAIFVPFDANAQLHMGAHQFKRLYN